MCLLKPSQGGIMWRTAKADVAGELNIPPQEPRMTHLAFRPIGEAPAHPLDDLLP